MQQWAYPAQVNRSNTEIFENAPNLPSEQYGWQQQQNQEYGNPAQYQQYGGYENNVEEVEVVNLSMNDNSGNFGSYPPDMFNSGLPNLDDLPDVPEVPVLDVPDFEEDPAIAELNRQCGFIIILNSRLIELQLEMKLNFPKLDNGKKKNKLKELFGPQYEKLVQQKAEAERAQKQLAIEVQQLRGLEQIVQDQTNEIGRLRDLNHSLATNVKSSDKDDIRSMMTEKSRSYVAEIEFQVTQYRDQLQALTGNLAKSGSRVDETVERLRQAQLDLTAARDEMANLTEKISFLQESGGANKDEVARLRTDLAQVRDQAAKEKENLAWQLDHTKNQLSVLQNALSDEKSRKVAVQEQVQSSKEEDLYKKITDLQEQLSLSAASQFEAQDKYEKTIKEHQELADKYRAKYESVKQHIKTLELQHGEYTRVNELLKKQNNEFRDIITNLQVQARALETELKRVKAQSQSQPSQANQMSGAAFMAQQAQAFNLIKAQNSNVNQSKPPIRQQSQPMQSQPMQPQQSQENKQNDIVRQMQQQQQMLLRQKQMQLQMQQAAQKQAQAQAVAQAQAQAQAKAQQAAQQAAQARPNAFMQRQHPAGLPRPNPQANGLPKPKPAVPPKNRDPVNPVPVQANWGRKTMTISQKGAKKRILVEWHFVTSDNVPHTIVLQHTQDNKAKTRRMLWVDGSEKYNNKSSASSFRIEIDKDVVVVTIELVGNQYQYRLTINGLSYSESFQLWKTKQGGQG